MPSPDETSLSRRSFVRQTSLAAGGLLLAGSGRLPAAEPAAAPKPDAASPASADLPRRTLGRTGASVTILTLGTAPCGMAKGVPPAEIARIVNLAIDLGINSIDTAPAYEKAEEGVGLALGARRKEVFLATKVGADTIADAEKSLSDSLRLLKTDMVDLLYFHSLASRKVEGAKDPEGVFHWLLRQKEAGKCRFVGVSGHHQPGLFPPFIAAGDVDVLLTVVNFVDRHTYAFEEKVLPAAQERQMGIIAMKVFGGASRAAGSYANRKAPPEMPLEHLPLAVRYALGVPGVATLNIGVHNQAQLRKNVELIRAAQPLTAAEQAQVTEIGKKLAVKWGEHFGPVA